MKYINIFYSIILVVLFAQCKEEQAMGPVVNDSVPPGTVKAATVQNLPGAALITYSLPNDEDLLYVKAVYSTKSGKKREAIASYYTNRIKVDGFGDTLTYNVDLFAVDRSGNASQPLRVTVQPLTPSIQRIFKSLKVQEDFGGIHLFWNNEYRADVSIAVMTPDTFGVMVPVETLYTSVADGDYAVRGFDNKKRLFGVVVGDRWDNVSDTIKVELTPWYEQEFDRRKFKKLVLPSDKTDAWGWTMERLWDNNYGSGFHTAQGGGMPQHFTFDLGVVAKLSRFKIWQRTGIYMFNHGNPRRWEMWGSQNPASDGSWNGWTKLRSCESVKPSGLPLGQNSNEDSEAANRGEEYIFPLDAPEVRYIRFNALESWSGGDFFHAMEIKFWGEVKNDQVN